MKKKINYKDNPLIQMELSRDDKENIFAPPLEPQKALNILTSYLLGDNYYIESPVNGKQANFIIVKDILTRNSKKFKKEYDQWRKEGGVK